MNRQKSAAAIVVPRERDEGPNVKYGSRRADLDAGRRSRSARECGQTGGGWAEPVRGRSWCRVAHGGCWVAYFRLTEVKGVLEDLYGWIRRKLRALLWRQWKRTYTRAKNLMRAGIDKVRAWRSATNGRGPWWNGGASQMNAAYPKSWFDRMGLVSLLDARQRLTSAS